MLQVLGSNNILQHLQTLRSSGMLTEAWRCPSAILVSSPSLLWYLTLSFLTSASGTTRETSGVGLQTLVRDDARLVGPSVVPISL